MEPSSCYTQNTSFACVHYLVYTKGVKLHNVAPVSHCYTYVSKSATIMQINAFLKCDQQGFTNHVKSIFSKKKWN